MWTVECAQCGGTIQATSPDDIERDVNNDPRHEDCPYAETPSMPTTVSIALSATDRAVGKAVKHAFPHLTPTIEEHRFIDSVPEPLQDIGSLSAVYEVRGDAEDLWDADVSLRTVNGERVASAVPRLVYECEACETRVSGKVVYDTDGYRPFVHETCSEKSARGTAPQFRPVDVSHLDSAVPASKEDDILEVYQAIYSGN